jgi:PIN domain nuclease of toxin-antitoxin system
LEASLSASNYPGAAYYPFPDPFDSVIMATARVMDLPLMTNDVEINASQLAEVYW